MNEKVIRDFCEMKWSVIFVKTPSKELIGGIKALN